MEKQPQFPSHSCCLPHSHVACAKSSWIHNPFLSVHVTLQNQLAFVKVSAGLQCKENEKRHILYMFLFCFYVQNQRLNRLTTSCDLRASWNSKEGKTSTIFPFIYSQKTDFTNSPNAVPAPTAYIAAIWLAGRKWQC